MVQYGQYALRWSTRERGKQNGTEHRESMQSMLVQFSLCILKSLFQSLESKVKLLAKRTEVKAQWILIQQYALNNNYC